MNQPGNVGPKIMFKGKAYQSIEDMPPEERAVFERFRTQLAQKYPGQDAEQMIDAALGQAEAFAGQVAKPAAPARAREGAASAIAVPLGFEKVTNLGEVVNSHLAQKYSQEFKVRAVAGGVLFIVGGGLDLLMLAAFLTPGNHSSPAGVLGMAITGTFLLLVGLILLLGPILTLLNPQKIISALVIYRDGFAYRTPQQIHTIPWTSVASILSDEAFHSGGRDTSSYEDKKYLLILKNGQQVTLTDDQFSGIDGIIHHIKSSVYAGLLPALQSAYQAGSTLVFGPVKISQSAGLAAHDRLFAWNTIYTVSVKRGRLRVVTKDEKTFDTRAKLIPNIEVLCQLIGVEPFAIDLGYF